MKFSTILATAAAMAVTLVHTATAAGTATATAVTTTDSAATATAILSAQEALAAAQKISTPAGVTLTGTADPISMPASATNKEDLELTAHQEQFVGAGLGLGLGLGLGGVGGVGGVDGLGVGGWGGLGPYRFGYSCGGIGGWAYPLGYWNTFGAGLWGGGCGLGLAYGGLYYC